MSVRVQAEDFSLQREYDEVLAEAGDAGAVVTFTGLVREFHQTEDSASVASLTLEHYPGMTESEIEMIIDQAKSRWPLAKITVIHRVGRMLPTENIVFVGCSSAHREAAFDGANFIMDFLKTKAPFWKLEDGPDGANWVDARDSDNKALDRWNLPE